MRLLLLPDLKWYGRKVFCVCEEERMQEQQYAEDFCASAIASGGTANPGVS